MAPTKAELEKLLLAQEIRTATAEADKAELELREHRASLDYNRHLIIAGIILDTDHLIEKLLYWSRRDPGQPITITLNTPGGSVFDGNALLGTLKALRDAGHELTIIGSGTVMSYGAILLQAADHRVLERDCVFMLHGISAPSVSGNLSEILDVTKMMKEVEERLLAAVSERATISKARIKTLIKRKDAFLTAEKALEYGFCDEVV